MKLVLHIGTEKTGSTAIQNALYSLEDTLAGAGVGLLKCLDSPNNRRLYAYVLYRAGREDPYFPQQGILAAADRARYFADFESALADEVNTLARRNITTLIISNEHLHSRIRTDQEFNILRSVLSPLFDEITVCAYFRSQKQLIKSLYSTSIKAGGTLDYDDFIEGGLADNHFFDYSVLSDKWTRHFPQARFLFRHYARPRLANGDVVTDFIRHMLGLDIATVFEHQDNRSLGPFGLKTLRFLNRHIPRYTRDGQLNRVSTALFRLVDAVPIAYRGTLDSRREADIDAHYHESNARFSQRFFDSPGEL